MKTETIWMIGSSMPVHCLLFFLLPFLGAAVVSQKTKDLQGGSNGGTTFDPDQKHTAASLEGAVLNLVALANTPGLDVFLDQIDAIANDTIQQRYEDWYKIKQQYDGTSPDYAMCNTTAACNASGYGNLSGYDDAHEQCRAAQSQLQNQLDGAHVCSAQHLEYISNQRHATCHDFKTITNKYPGELPSLCDEKTIDNDSNEAYFKRVQTYFDNKLVDWNAEFDECQAVIDEYANVSKFCKNLTESLENKTQECDGKQGVLDALSCQLSQVTGDCTGFKMCWDSVNAGFSKIIIQNQEEKMLIDAEIGSMKRVKCLTDALVQQGTGIEEALASCQSSNFTANSTEVDYAISGNDLQPPPDCTFEVHCIVARPCTPNYVDKYFNKLPLNAPAAPSTVECCTRCEFYDECPAGLKNPHAEEITGFNDDKCCVKSSWKVGDWSPYLVGESCPTGCGTAATIYERTVECVNEYGGHVQESTCTGEKKNTSLHCNATTQCPGCDHICEWGYEMKGCNPNSSEVTGSCEQCHHVLGHYFLSAGSCATQICNNTCSIGYYLKDCESSFGNPGTCAPCTPVNGTYITGPGHFIDGSCPTNKCTSCSPGDYNADCGGMHPGTCLPCTGQNNSGIAGLQEYFTGPGTLGSNTSCPKALCDYAQCPVGQVLVQCGLGNPGSCIDCQTSCNKPDETSCPATCAWDADTNTCYASQYVVPGQLGQCRFSPCLSTQCPSGQYLSGCGGVSPGTCQPCDAAPEGRWYNGPGGLTANCPSVECPNCSIGEYRAQCGGTSVGVCTACSPPPNEFYSTSHGGFTDNCSSQACINVTCPAGKYRYGCGYHSAGSCISCKTHVAGQYFSGSGGLSDSCPTATCDPSVCPVGYYLKNCGGHLAPASNGTCVKCTPPPLNYYWVTNGGTTNQCKAAKCYDLETCPAAYYRMGCGGPLNETGTGFCTACTDLKPGHFYTGEGNLSGSCPQKSCDTLPDCDNGHVLANCGPPSNPTSEGDCDELCPPPPAGYFHFEGCLLQACPDCGAGQLRKHCGVEGNTSDIGICVECPPTPFGQYYDPSGPSGCHPQPCANLPDCGLGMYRTACGNTSEGKCVECDHPHAGFYITGGGAFENSTCPASDCDHLDPCAHGHWRAACGSPSENPGHCAQCDPPPEGQFYVSHGDWTGPTSCYKHNCSEEARCPVGWYRNECGEIAANHYTTAGQCELCSPPPEESYYITDGGIHDDCSLASCHSGDLACEPGFYRIHCGGPEHPIGTGTCVMCSPPGSGRYYVGHGFTNDSCPSEQCENECYIGEFRTKCGGFHNPSSPGYCTSCSAYLMPGNVWLSDGDLDDSCTQGPKATVAPAFTMTTTEDPTGTGPLR